MWSCSYFMDSNPLLAKEGSNSTASSLKPRRRHYTFLSDWNVNVLKKCSRRRCWWWWWWCWWWCNLARTHFSTFSQTLYLWHNQSREAPHLGPLRPARAACRAFFSLTCPSLPDSSTAHGGIKKTKHSLSLSPPMNVLMRTKKFQCWLKSSLDPKMFEWVSINF